MTLAGVLLPSKHNETAPAATLHVVEVEDGHLNRWRRDHLFSQDYKKERERYIFVSCAFEHAGPWAGVNDLFEQILPELSQDYPELIARHAMELTSVLPALRRTLVAPHQALTDIATGEEKVRNYAADRALRNVHGLIDMLCEWNAASSPALSLVIVCDAFHRAGSVGGHFFRELYRRCTPQLCLSLVLVTDRGMGTDLVETFGCTRNLKLSSLGDSMEAPAAILQQDEATHLATEIEERIGDDPIEKQLRLPALLKLWEQAGDSAKVIRLKLFGLAIYLHEGLYTDALRFSDGLLTLARSHEPDNVGMHRDIVMKVLNGLLGIPDATGAMKLIHEEVLPLSILAPDTWKIDAYYLVAMTYARYCQPRDYRRGEVYLDLALTIIERADLREERRHFLYVFNRNGLAMIRSFQRRSKDAIDLCKSGLAHLDTHVPRDHHRLHRSVLVYNIAKVYAATGKSDEAIQFYSDAIEMDPFYSEYYNERGSLHLMAGRLDAALADYRKAAELSPPYYEVLTNLGQCYRMMGLDAEAIAAYTKSLDLEPTQLLAWLGRAQSRECLMQIEEAICDYTSAIARDPEQWEALASRGALYYTTGRLEFALQDLSAAIALAPDRSDLVQNRSLVFSALLAQDIRLALSLNPCEEDRAHLTKRLKEVDTEAAHQVHA